jgi:hypothetical protein
MAERAVTQIVEQPSDPQEGLDEGLGRAITMDLRQRRVDLASEAARNVHGPEGVLKPAVLGRGINPERTLQLMNVSQSLDPGMIQQGFLGGLFPQMGTGAGVMNVSMDGIRDDPHAFKGIHLL